MAEGVDVARLREVEWFGMAQLRNMSADRLRALEKPALVTGRRAEPPLAALVPYGLYLKWLRRLSPKKSRTR